MVLAMHRRAFLIPGMPAPLGSLYKLDPKAAEICNATREGTDIKRVLFNGESLRVILAAFQSNG